MKLAHNILLCSLLATTSLVAQESITHVPSVIPEVELVPTTAFGEYLKPVQVESTTASVPETVFSAFVVLIGLLMMTRRRHA